MAKQLHMLGEAIVEARDAWIWYRDRSEKVGERFRIGFEQGIEEISAHPDRWPNYLRGTKCLMVKRFPYLLIYRELEEEIQIIAVAHGHRRKGYWKERLH